MVIIYPQQLIRDPLDSGVRRAKLRAPREVDLSVYLVTWDLNKQKANYNAARLNLISHLERYEHIKDPGLDSVWFLSTSVSTEAVNADIRTRLDNNDRLIVTKLVNGNHQGWLGQDVWAWINARL